MWKLCVVILIGVALIGHLYFSDLTETQKKERERAAEKEKEKKKQFWKSHEQWQINQIAKEMIYFKDSSTGLCFAYYWGGNYQGGPALVLVPEESIPVDRLLITNKKQD